jgi:predicted RNase H-like HicB family nuclease
MATKGNIEKELEYYAKLPYTVIVEQWDDGEGPYWVARIAELPHCLIHADTPEEVIKEIQEVKMDWIKSNLERGLRILSRGRANIVVRSDSEFRLHFINYLPIELKRKD